MHIQAKMLPCNPCLCCCILSCQAVCKPKSRSWCGQNKNSSLFPSVGFHLCKFLNLFQNIDTEMLIPAWEKGPHSERRTELLLSLTASACIGQTCWLSCAFHSPFRKWKSYQLFSSYESARMTSSAFPRVFALVHRTTEEAFHLHKLWIAWLGRWARNKSLILPKSTLSGGSTRWENQYSKWESWCQTSNHNLCVFSWVHTCPKTTALMATVARVIQSSQGTLICEIRRWPLLSYIWWMLVEKELLHYFPNMSKSCRNLQYPSQCLILITDIAEGWRIVKFPFWYKRPMKSESHIGKFGGILGWSIPGLLGINQPILRFLETTDFRQRCSSLRWLTSSSASCKSNKKKKNEKQEGGVMWGTE